MSRAFLLPVNLPDYFDAMVRVALGFFIWFSQSWTFFALGLALLGTFLIFLKK